MKILLSTLLQLVCNDTSLRVYQFENKLRIYNEWQNCNSVLLQMPTGTGKTRLFSSIVSDIRSCTMKDDVMPSVLLIVHRKELVNQIAETLASYGLKYGIIQSGVEEERYCHVQVASVQTLVRRLQRWGKIRFEFVIIDEAHHAPAKTYMKILDTFSGAKLLGVTATPHRLDGWGFAHIFEKLIVSDDVGKFIENGFLANYDYYSVPSDSSIVETINSLPTELGDYSDEDIRKYLDIGSVRARVVDSYLKFGKGKKCIVYAWDTLHNNNLCKDYRSRGINAVTIDYHTPPLERKQILDAFKRGEIQVLCNVLLFTEGFDCPDVEVIQLARPTWSLVLFLQQVGRGLRISPGKEKAIFIDNVGSYTKFGLPSTHRNWQAFFNSTPKVIHPWGYVGLGGGSCESGVNEGNEEVRLIYSTAPEKSVENTTATSNVQQTVNKKLAPILLLASYL